MCGIFAYMGHKPIPIIEVLKVLRRLEKEQEPGEKSPVGGHGAGTAYLNQRSEFTITKVGKTNGSPVDDLALQLKEKATNSCFILAHVRHASPEFQTTIKHKECTQPYKPACTRGKFNLVSAHNGLVQNYQQLKNKLRTPHKFESEKIELIDSEIIPHLYEEFLTQTKNQTKATHTLFDNIEGTNKQGNTIIIISKHRNKTHINVIQKGKTRGLVIWTNPEGDVLICSREKPVQKTLHKFLVENNYQKIIHITRNDSANLETHFTLNPPTTTAKPSHNTTLTSAHKYQ